MIFFFTISILEKIFGHLDATNTAIQKKQLYFGNVKLLIQTLHNTIKSFRDQFEEFWKMLNEKKIIFEIDSPKLKRKRKMPKKLDSSENNFKDCYTNIEDKYKRLYYEIIDNVLNCLEKRFETEVNSFLMKAEKFVLGDDMFQHEVVDYFGSDINSKRLILHRNMLRDILQGKSLSAESITNFNDVICLLQQKQHIADLLSELVKFVKLILTIPVTTCTAERSFSSLRRLLTYLRSTMTQSRLNSLSILHVHMEEAMKLDLDAIANEFINRNEIRRANFSLS